MDDFARQIDDLKSVKQRRTILCLINVIYPLKKLNYDLWRETVKILYTKIPMGSALGK